MGPNFPFKQHQCHFPTKKDRSRDIYLIHNGQGHSRMALAGRDTFYGPDGDQQLKVEAVMDLALRHTKQLPYPPSPTPKKREVRYVLVAKSLRTLQILSKHRHEHNFTQVMLRCDCQITLEFEAVCTPPYSIWTEAPPLHRYHTQLVYQTKPTHYLRSKVSKYM